jgi:L-serine dehydratase
MALSVFDLFRIGIGPSSSHTLGPITAARRFLEGLQGAGLLGRVSAVHVDLYGALGATGLAHGSDRGVLLGLLGERPETIDPDAVDELLARARSSGTIALLGHHEVPFKLNSDLVMHRRASLRAHPNGMRFTALGEAGAELQSAIYYSVGGGFVVDEETLSGTKAADAGRAVPYPFDDAAALLAHCDSTGWSISDVMLANEAVWRDPEQVRDGLRNIWHVMSECVRRGCTTEGFLPGPLKVPRRAPQLARELGDQPSRAEPLAVLDWVDMYALAVSEENAAGGRVVTAPTNGAAGVIPAVLHYYREFVPGSSEEGVGRFLLTAGAIGALCKENASISGAEVGCQGEVGSACAMAAAGLCEVMGGSPHEVENAAEIGIEHNLGLTCDPVGGFVQIPCIERNAMAAVKAINAARMALRGDGTHLVSLDKALRTMRQTGADMQTKYKETGRGGLAVNMIEC